MYFIKPGCVWKVIKVESNLLAKYERLKLIFATNDLYFFFLNSSLVLGLFGTTFFWKSVQISKIVVVVYYCSLVILYMNVQHCDAPERNSYCSLNVNQFSKISMEVQRKCKHNIICFAKPISVIFWAQVISIVFLS